MKKKLQGWNFNPNASFGKTEVQILLIFPVLPIGWAAPGTQPRGSSRTLPGHAKPHSQSPGVEEVNTAGRNPSSQGGKKPMMTTQCTSKSSWVVGEGGLRFSPGFVFWGNRKKSGIFSSWTNLVSQFQQITVIKHI